MSISLYSGTPGSYKSYHAVKECISWLKLGRNLITNFPLNYSNKINKPIEGIYQCVNNLDLTVDYLIDFAVKYHKPSVRAQTLVVIDEASIKFNSRDFNLKDRMGWINFFANHRHFNFDVILITQQDRMLDRQIRGLIETEYKHRALKNYKFFGFLLNLIFHGCFMCVEYWYPCKLRNGAQFCVFRQKIADCYDTMGLFVDSQNKMAASRKKIEDIQNKKEQEMLTIDDFEDPKTKKQINKNIVKLLNVLNNYIQYGVNSNC